MNTLTESQIAAGWIAHDGKGFPESLRGTRVIVLFREDWVANPAEEREPHVAEGYASSAESPSDWWLHANCWHDIIAWRFPEPATQQALSPAPKPAETVIDANLPMLRRDERPAYDIDKMAGNGMIFGTPRVERSPLSIVAPIPATGFSAAWGARS